MDETGQPIRINSPTAMHNEATPIPPPPPPPQGQPLPPPQPQPSAPSASASQRSQENTKSRTSKGLSDDRGESWGKELRCMMYGFGDDKNPYTESVELLEDLVLNFINETTRKAIDVGRTGKIKLEDIMYLIRKDKRKSTRVKELLSMNEELKRSRCLLNFDLIDIPKSAKDAPIL